VPAGAVIFVLVVILIVGWFALGTHINVRKGHQFLEWLQAGLPLIGEKTTLRWLGSSVVQLKIENAHGPFRRAEILVVLEPRDVPLLWLFSRMHGRRDLLIVRAELRNQPTLQVEVLDRAAWSTQAIAREIKQLNWQLQSPLDNEPFQVYSFPPGADAAELIQEARRCNLPLVRLGVRRSNKSLEVQWQLPARLTPSSSAVMESVQRVAQAL
jgi:hypothetical protein